ncbi:hypothetical protein FHR90_001344 [Endobacter medicaginis]|uniref:Uncharacterized protein n=1 Tax=Endobacter medicaginis TaxID=1181271 RepID=A0A850NN73_9PROT|nr:hypothetical protein [Endobacter medicaginis]MBB3173521.1 hypothetical protein [Endobacter medicaginis]MCX5475390.1 hypothetical protein [Endobacter medicaginis]NVN29849.1 hypothetical protein [Endobacter medicaginis]
MSGFDWQRGEDRDRNAGLRTQAVAGAPQRLSAALDRIADALVSLTLERDQAPPAADQPPPERVAIADHHTIALVEERLDSAIAMLRSVLNTPVASAEPPGEAEAAAHHDAPHHDG